MSTGALLLLMVVALVGGMGCAFLYPRLWLLATLLGLGAGLAASAGVLGGGAAWEWQPGFKLGGQAIHLRLDGVSAFFLALTAVLGGAGTLYSVQYWTDREHPASAPRGRVWWNALMVSLALVLLASNGLHFLLAWELFAVVAYFLITLERRRAEVRSAGWLYLAASHLGTLCLFAFFGTMAARTGTWDLGPLRERSDLAPLFWLALLGFGIKAGLFPLHVWLPSAHASAPSHVSAIMSGVAIKMGIYGLVRFTGWLPFPDAAGWVVVLLGVVSAVLGVAFALGQHDLKRLLAYHSVENIGIILIGLGFAMMARNQGNPAWGRLALAGGLLHVWNHGLFKGLLFLGAGSVLHATGTREMSRLGGLWRGMPWTAGLFVLGAAAIAGLPPLNGFVSEWLVYLGLFDGVSARGSAGWAAIPAAVLLGMTGALALACFVKVCGVVFLGVPRSREAAQAHECGPFMRAGMLVLAAACVAIGLAPTLFWPALARALGDWQPEWSRALPPTSLVNLGAFHLALASLGGLAAAALWSRVQRNGVARALTWDCGYAAPTPRMQYTAGSFAAIITAWFAWILRPRHHTHVARSPFPAKARYDEHTPETVLEALVLPVARRVMGLSTAIRRFQHGRLQAYILYLLIGLAVLAVLAVLGGRR
jgi:hydrogenase-4 component B